MNHAVIQCDSDGVVLLDKGSLNKTKLNKVLNKLLFTQIFIYIYFNIFYGIIEKFKKRCCLFS